MLQTVSKIAHKLVAKTAFEIACEVYEVLAGSNNRFYKLYPTVESFTSNCWSEFIGDARKALTRMLQPEPGSDPKRPTFKFSEHIRNEIFEALCLEGEIKSSPPMVDPRSNLSPTTTSRH